MYNKNYDKPVHSGCDEVIGGYKRDGENVTTLQGFEEILGQDFKLIDSRDIPFVIQETARKHQHDSTNDSVGEALRVYRY